MIRAYRKSRLSVKESDKERPWGNIRQNSALRPNRQFDMTTTTTTSSIHTNQQYESPEKHRNATKDGRNK
ncbi:hypothetical protein RSOLAG1IB_01355 [Rhizoctonia solani AG-1 IB]|uniref:Uncharacterized protein n=1 Tax=Thanatephorus cucumeris (strain AG1-IB / isolate 7/3/14) TaxID=1108050 RepID=A0A0B7FCN1_THACB|nr:hypothetical protein RSOLAG1IB_01355 [Rhizoctonia solani AG-1 IB]